MGSLTLSRPRLTGLRGYFLVASEDKYPGFNINTCEKKTLLFNY